MFNKKVISLATHAAIYSVIILPQQAIAQSNEAEQAGLERITVTSQKRLESIQDIPTSIQAFSGENLEKASINNLLDMSESVPNVHITETSSSKRIFVRGIGSGTNAGFEQSVAMYKDGIYLGRGHQAIFPFLDMQRIELVKGPQAVMFGKNATAGAFSMISNSPSDENEGSVSIEYGSDNEHRINVIGNLVINDDLALRFAGFDSGMDGYVYNKARKKDEPSTDSQGFRVSANWQVSDKLNALIKWEHATLDTQGSRYQYIIDTENRNAQIASDPSNLGNVGYRSFLLSDDSGLDYVSAVSGDDHPNGLNEGNTTTADNAVLQLTYDLGLYEFSAITTYSEYDWTALFDADYAEISLIRQEHTEKYDQFTQEFRISSPTGNQLEYVAGLFYMNSSLDHPNDILLGASLLIPELAGTSVGTNAQVNQDQESYSAFASLTWNMNSQWKSNLGLRYQHEQKDITSEQGVYALFAPNTPEPIQQFANAAAPSIASNLSGAGQHDLVASRSESHWSPSISIQYLGFEDTMMFASAGIGYKAGGFDGSGLNASMGNSIDPNSGFEFEDEKATNFELGIKSEVIKNTWEVNATLFHTIYDDLQVSEFNGNAFVVKNAAKTQVQGLEIDTRWMINDAWDLSANLALLDFEYQHYIAASPTVRQAELLGMESQDLSGQTGAFAPKYSGNIALNYHTEVASGYPLSANLSVNFSDDYFLEQDLDPISKQDAYYKVNFRIELSDVDDAWRIALLGKNLTDEQTFAQANDVPVISYAHRFLTERPRSFHLQASYNF
ncbi:TonB-dependent receptor [Thalassotalea sp. PLHSN55]|uniref:TonB-dependent receptor n=1 Tax=Thalassotalea sp. PLHSN55 TaxID=3435888 RepID=UPI003F86CE6C